MHGEPKSFWRIFLREEIDAKRWEKLEVQRLFLYLMKICMFVFITVLHSNFDLNVAFPLWSDRSSAELIMMIKWSIITCTVN